MLPVLLVGDSHLANLSGTLLLELERASGCGVVNAAVGGANVHDVVAQLALCQLSGIVVVSVGTNDAAPWKRVPLAEFRSKVVETLTGLRGCRVIYLAALGVDETRLTGPNDRLDAEMKRYAGVAIEVLGSAGARIIDLADELSTIRTQAFAPDGVHLSTVAYDLVVSMLGAAIATIQSEVLAANRDGVSSTGAPMF